LRCLSLRHRSPIASRLGGGYDFAVCDQCHTFNNSYSNLGPSYTNDTGIAANQVLTGAREFNVEELEVFELI
jgi:hypothetical protein